MPRARGRPRPKPKKPKKKHCRFLDRLPPELRNSIYELVFKDTTFEPVNHNRWKRPQNQALLATCRQIRHEALHIFYHETAFIATSAYVAYRFLTSIQPASVSSIRAIHITRYPFFGYKFPRARIQRKLVTALAAKGIEISPAVFRFVSGSRYCEWHVGYYYRRCDLSSPTLTTTGGFLLLFCFEHICFDIGFQTPERG
jgi:hypothetical protein